jgi:hypothetical protein
MLFRGVQNQDQIFKKWSKLINASNDIQDESVKMSTAIVLENAQSAVDYEHQTRNGRSLLFEGAGINDASTFGANQYANANGDARVPSIVIPMIRRIYPQLIAHKLVGVQPMQGPIGMAFAFRAKYGRFGRGPATTQGKEIGYTFNDPSFTGAPSIAEKFSQTGEGTAMLAPGQKAVDGFEVVGPSGAVAGKKATGTVDALLSGTQVSGVNKIDADINKDENIRNAAGVLSYFFGSDQQGLVGDGADTSDAENWAVGSTMPEAGFELLKATVTAKTRKLGVQITRETEEDMKSMQGLNAQQEISDILSYEISQEMDRQLLGEIVQAAVNAGNTMVWDPAKADGRNQNERINTLYTTILTKSAQIAVQSRRGAANWCVASPTAAALLESNIVNPLGVGGGLGNANAFGKSIDNGIGVTEIGALRNGTIKLYRDTLAGGDYILLGFKGNNVYDAGIIYLPFIPLELMQAQSPFTFNPITAARTRYGVTTNLFGAGQFYQFIGLKNTEFSATGGQRVFWQ